MKDIDAALDIARQKRADGGMTIKKFHSGPIHSHVAGRTDHLPMTVASGSYVLPADIVSAGGQGNTMAGYKALRRTFGGDPYAQSGSPYGQKDGPYGAPIGRKTGGRVRAAGVMYLSPDNEVLLLKRAGGDHAGTWGFPAGHIEKGETPEKAARRETEEETGYEHDGGLSPFMHSQTEGGDFVTFLAHTRGRTIPTLNREHSDSKWASLDDAEKLNLHPGVRKAIEKYRARKAHGGASSGVPIIAAGGEWVIPPEHVREVGNGDLDMGHRVLDEFVKRVRKELIGTLQKLPGPAKD